MKEEKIKFGLIGCGRIGKRHAEIVSQHPQMELTAACDLRADALQQLGVDTHCYQDAEGMLRAHPDIEVAIIATPNALHVPQAILCLEAGKHVIVEKPLALDKPSAERLIYTALHYNRKVFTVMQNRYSPPARWLKELTESDKLGRINLVQINCFWNRDERYYTGEDWHGKADLDGGTLFTQFSHFIDILYWLFGDIENIQSRLQDFNHQDLTDFEDTGVVTFELVNGGMGILNFSTSCWKQNFESSMTIIAEKGTIKVGGQYFNQVEYCEVDGYELPELAPVKPANQYGEIRGSAANHSFVYDNVLAVLKGQGSITTNALEGLKVVEIIERIYKSSNNLST